MTAWILSPPVPSMVSWPGVHSAFAWALALQFASHLASTWQEALRVPPLQLMGVALALQEPSHWTLAEPGVASQEASHWPSH